MITETERLNQWFKRWWNSLERHRFGANLRRVPGVDEFMDRLGAKMIFESIMSQERKPIVRSLVNYGKKQRGK